MSLDSTSTEIRPPVALGCFFAAAVVIGLAGIIIFAVMFLDSGADTGQVRLDVPEAYAEGSIEFVGSENLYLVRFPDGSFVALADLDADNQANQGHRCRIAPASLADPALAARAAALSSAMSARAAGSTTVLTESCLGAIYDVAGTRLGTEGANLDRFPVSVGADGHLRVDTSKRVCSRRTEAAESRSTACK